MKRVVAAFVVAALGAPACGGADAERDRSTPGSQGGAASPELRGALPTAASVPNDVPNLPTRDPEPLPSRKRPEVLPASVLFDTGRSTLKPSADRALGGLMERVTRLAPDATVVVTGHTDSRGATDANLALSEGRAQAVVDWFVAAGWDRGRLLARGRGESYLLVEDRGPDGEFLDAAGRRNRRVEIVVVPAGS